MHRKSTSVVFAPTKSSLIAGYEFFKNSNENFDKTKLLIGGAKGWEVRGSHEG